MPRNLKRFLLMLLTCVVMVSVARGQTTAPQGPDLTKEPTLYVVGYAHLDTVAMGVSQDHRGVPPQHHARQLRPV